MNDDGSADNIARDKHEKKYEKYRAQKKLEAEVFMFKLGFEKSPTLDMQSAVTMLHCIKCDYPEYADLQEPIQSLVERGLLQIDSATLRLTDAGTALMKFCADHWFSESQNEKLMTKKISGLEKTVESKPYMTDRESFDAVIDSLKAEEEETRKKSLPCPKCGQRDVKEFNFATWTGYALNPDTGEQMQTGGMNMDGDCESCGAMLRLDEGMFGEPSKWVLREQ